MSVGPVAGAILKRLVIGTLACLLVSATGSRAAEMKTLFPAAMRTVMTELIPKFERGSGHKVNIDYGTVGAIIARPKAGEAVDVATVTLEPPSNLDRVSSFLNMRVADIDAAYKQWRTRGAQFLTPPIDRGAEIRCYMRDPDGHLIEVGQLVRRPDG